MAEVRERPILFSGPMVRAILKEIEKPGSGKTQTRRLITPQPPTERRRYDNLGEMVGLPPDQFWKPTRSMREFQGGIGSPDHHAAVEEFFAEDNRTLCCPYGKPGDRLTCYHCGHDNTSRWHATHAHPSVTERRLPRGLRRSDLQQDSLCGIRQEDPDRLVSPARSCNDEGLSVGVHVPRREEGDQERAPSGLHGLPWNASEPEPPGSASRRVSGEQPAGESLLGVTGGELARQEGPRQGQYRGEPPLGEVHRCGAAPPSMGGESGVVQHETCLTCARCGIFLNPGDLRRGDILWVRESWRSWEERCLQEHEEEPCNAHCQQIYVAYKASPREGFRPRPDGARITYLHPSTPLETRPELLGPWRPSIHMPRWASRISLEVTGVRVERLQEISTADAMAEGIPQTAGEAHVLGLLDLDKTPGHEWDNRTTIENFAAIWDAINGKRAPWNTSPWVWVIEFRPYLRDCGELVSPPEEE